MKIYKQKSYSKHRRNLWLRVKTVNYLKRYKMFILQHIKKEGAWFDFFFNFKLFISKYKFLSFLSTKPGALKILLRDSLKSRSVFNASITKKRSALKALTKKLKLLEAQVKPKGNIIFKKKITTQALENNDQIEYKKQIKVRHRLKEFSYKNWSWYSGFKNIFNYSQAIRYRHLIQKMRTEVKAAPISKQNIVASSKKTLLKKKNQREKNNNIAINRNSSFYDSYWIGRLIAMFIKNGQKIKIVKYFQKIILFLKYFYHSTLLQMIYPLLETFKPLFSINKRVLKRKSFTEFPRITSLWKRHFRALQWVGKEIKTVVDQRGQKTLFYIVVFYKFCEIFDNWRKVKTPMHKARDLYDFAAVRGQNHIRFGWKKRGQKL